MNKDIFEYIKTLTLKDKKTLSQKVVKTMEEVGELSREILPYENADGTRHRFTIKESILEESVDAILCLLSIAYETGATDDQIEKMLWRKAEYWNSLQVGESGAKFPLPFEIHVTVDAKDQDLFKTACMVAGVKKINLDLIGNDGKCIKHETMTASKMIGTNKEAYDELCRICDVMDKYGIVVLRRKIETVPWHPAAVSGLRKYGSYFETHFNVTLSTTYRFDELVRKVYHNSYDSHGVISINTNKKNNEGILITVRHFNKEEVESVVNAFKIILQDYNPREFLMEYAIYDTNESHDSSWINS